MSIFSIAINNLKRRKAKMIFLMVGLLIGVATVVGILNIIEAMNIELGNRIDEFGANAIIIPRSEGLEMSYGDSMVSDLTFDVQSLTMEEIPKIYESSISEYINIVSPKLVGAVSVEGINMIIVGIQTQEEFAQKPWLSLNESVDEKFSQFGELSQVELPENSIIIGSNVATVLNIKVGENLNINGNEFNIFGILKELGSEEDGLIYGNLFVVQNLLNRKDELSMIEISAYCNFCPIEEVAAVLNQDISNGRTIALREAALFREETIHKFSAFGLGLSSMVLLISSLIVFITMLSSINERTREIGIFRSIGFRRADIVKIIFIEVSIVSFVSGVLGYTSGSLVARYIGPYLANLQGEVAMRLDYIIPSIVFSMVIAIIASLYPALKAIKLNPAEALRFI